MATTPGKDDVRGADAAKGPFDGPRRAPRRQLWGWIAVAAVAVALAVGWAAMDGGPFSARDREATSTQPPAASGAGAPATIPPATGSAPAR